ncbi:Ras guanine nucleotide exchange factor bud5, variant 2 [Balamuthia mandrillaris]
MNQTQGTCSSLSRGATEKERKDANEGYTTGGGDSVIKLQGVGKAAVIQRLCSSLSSSPSVPVTHLLLDNNELEEYPQLPPSCPPPQKDWAESLLIVSLSGNKLTEAPPELSSLGKLVQLDLSRNQLCEFPSSHLLHGLSSLTSLKLDYNCIGNSLPQTLLRQKTNSPSSSCSSSSLTELSLSHNGVTSLPQDFGEAFPQLRRLGLKANKLQGLPAGFGKLAFLTALDLSRNEFKTLPCVLSSLHNLLSLDLSRNRIATNMVTEETEGKEERVVIVFSQQMQHLTELNLSHNNISCVEECGLFALPSLERLDLSHNTIADLHKDIGRVTGLKHLQLQHNLLSCLPSSMILLTSLRKLKLHSNRFVLPPYHLRQLDYLQKFTLHDNPLPANTLAKLKQDGALALITTGREKAKLLRRCSGVRDLEGFGGVPRPRGKSFYVELEQQEGAEATFQPNSFSRQQEPQPQQKANGAKGGSWIKELRRSIKPPRRSHSLPFAEDIRVTKQSLELNRTTTSSTPRASLDNQNERRSKKWKDKSLSWINRPKNASFPGTKPSSSPVTDMIEASTGNASSAAASMKEEDFEQLMEDFCVAEAKREPLRLLSSHAKHLLVQQWTKARRKDSQNLSAETLIAEIKQGASLEHLQKLRVFLSTHPPSWASAFIKHDGLGALQHYFIAFSQKTDKEEAKSIESHGNALQSVKILLQDPHTRESVLQSQGLLTAIILSPGSSHQHQQPKTKIGVLQFMQSLCRMPEGHKILLACLDEVSQNESTLATNNPFVWLASHLQHSPDPECKSVCMSVVNEIINEPDDVERRAALRQCFLELKAIDLSNHQHNISPGASTVNTTTNIHERRLAQEIDVFLHEMQEDNMHGAATSLLEETMRASWKLNVSVSTKLSTEREDEEEEDDDRVNQNVVVEMKFDPSCSITSILYQVQETLAQKRIDVGTIDEHTQEWALYWLEEKEEEAEAAADTFPSRKSGKWLEPTLTLSSFGLNKRKGQLSLRPRHRDVFVQFLGRLHRFPYPKIDAKIQVLIGDIALHLALPKHLCDDYGLFLPNPELVSTGSSAGNATLELNTLSCFEEQGLWLDDTKTFGHYLKENGHRDSSLMLCFMPRPRQLNYLLASEKSEARSIQVLFTWPAIEVVRHIIESNSGGNKASPSASSKGQRSPSLSKKAAEECGQYALYHCLSQQKQQEGDATTMVPLDLQLSLKQQSVGYGATVLLTKERRSSRAAMLNDTDLWQEIESGSINLVFSKDRMDIIDGGSLNALVTYFTGDHMVEPLGSQNDLRGFLLVYRRFTTPEVLLRKFKQRYQVPSGMGSTKNAVQKNVANVLLTWLQTHPSDFAGDMLSQLKDLFDVFRKDGHSKQAKDLQAVMGQMQTKQQNSPSLKRVRERHKSLKRELELDTATFMDFDAQEIAKQLCVQSFEYFALIPISELLNGSWEKASESPHVAAVIERFNNLSRALCKCILQEEKLRKRAKLLSHLVDIAQHLLAYNNFSDLMAFISCFNNACISRLKWTFEKLPVRTKDILWRLQKDMSMEHSYKHYRKLLQRVKGTKPCIPYLYE